MTDHAKHKAALSEYSRRSGHTTTYHEAESPQEVPANQKITDRNAPYPYNKDMPYHKARGGEATPSDTMADYRYQRENLGGGTAEGSNAQYRLSRKKHK